jgi:glyoxylase-like metal-dependent hydrolase (beta-lactamase superfamily II)
MRVAALVSDVIVFMSDVWQTTCTAVRAGDEGFVIDSPIYPEELRAIPDVLTQAGFPVSGLLATHGDWDHLLGRLAFSGASLGCAESTVRRLTAEPGAAQRKLRDFDAEHYVEPRRRLALGDVQSLPVPGNLELGPSRELELHEATGHTPDGVAYWLPWLKVLVCGDYLSPVEIPMLSTGGSIAAYAGTLERLRELVRAATWIVPGHGAPLQSKRALKVLSEDEAYLEQLTHNPSAAKLPRSRSSAAQRRIHEANVALTTSSRQTDGPP